MSWMERVGFRLLRSANWRIRELADSWSVALCSRQELSGHELFRTLNRTCQNAVLTDVILNHAVDLVIDVGANRGSFASEIRQLGYTGPILSVEANPGVFSLLERNSASDEAWHVRNVGISLERGEMELYTTQDDSFSSSKKPSEYSKESFGDISSVTGSVTVPVVPLCELVTELQDTTQVEYRSILLKTDTQGMDREVIRSCGEVMPHVCSLFVEMPLKAIYEDVPDFQTLYTEYCDYGFNLVFNAPVSWGKSGEIIELDCLFARQRN